MRIIKALLGVVQSNITSVLSSACTHRTITSGDKNRCCDRERRSGPPCVVASAQQGASTRAYSAILGWCRFCWWGTRPWAKAVCCYGLRRTSSWLAPTPQSVRPPETQPGVLSVLTASGRLGGSWKSVSAAVPYSRACCGGAGVDFRTKYVTMQNKRLKLTIWDTAGRS